MALGEEDAAPTHGAMPTQGAISPRRELGAYEALWLEPGASFKTLAERFAAQPGAQG